MKNRKNKK